MSQHQTKPNDRMDPPAAAPDQDDSGTDWSNTGSPAGGDGSEAPEWATSGSRWSGAGATASAQAWLSQLEAIIDNLATQSAPVIREVGAKAAEIAALAADRAGPLALRAADATAQATVRVAERSRTIAADLRRRAGEAPSGDRGQGAGHDETSTL